MAPIYLTGSSDARPVTYFTERGLVNSKAVEMSQLVCNAIRNDDYNPAYQSILSNMHVFGQCQIERSVSITSIGSFRVLQTISILGMSFQVPTMGVCFNQLSEEQSQTLRSYGLQEDPKTKFSYRGSPQPHELSAILNMHPNEQRFIPGAIPFNGYLAYTFALQAISEEGGSRKARRMEDDNEDAMLL